RQRSAARFRVLMQPERYAEQIPSPAVASAERSLRHHCAEQNSNRFDSRRRIVLASLSPEAAASGSAKYPPCRHEPALWRSHPSRTRSLHRERSFPLRAVPILSPPETFPRELSEAGLLRHVP